MKIPLPIPASTAESPSWRERVAVFLLVFVPYAGVYEYFILQGTPDRAVYTNLPFEATWPVWEWTQIMYDLAYPFVLLIPFVLKTKQALRRLLLDSTFGTALVGFLYLVFPFAVHQRDFAPQTWAGELLLLERSMDGETCALPSFHVIWALIASQYFSISFPKWRWMWYALAVLISLSCLSTGNHSVLDVLAGAGAFVLIRCRQKLTRIC